jgi:hypothetical protein
MVRRSCPQPPLRKCSGIRPVGPLQDRRDPARQGLQPPAWTKPRQRQASLTGLNRALTTRIPGSVLMIFGGVIGFAPGFLQYKYPLSGPSTKERSDV